MALASGLTVDCAAVDEVDDEFAAVAQYIGELPALVRFLRARFPDLASDAEDIAQDTLVAVRRRIAHVDKPVAYLYEAAKRRAYTVWNKSRRVVLAGEGSEEGLRVHTAADPAPGPRARSTSTRSSRPCRARSSGWRCARTCTR